MDGDLSDHTADERFAVFRLACLFLDKGNHCLDSVDLVLPHRSLRENVLPPFTEGHDSLADFLDPCLILAGIEEIHLALAYHVVDDLDLLIDVAADNALDVLLQNRDDIVPVIGSVYFCVDFFV